MSNITPKEGEMLHLQTYTDPHEWYTRVEAFLLEREAEHNLIFGLSHIVRHQPDIYPDFYLAVVTDDTGRIVGAALRTAPHNLILSHFTNPDAVRLLAESIEPLVKLLPGVTGAPAEIDAFVPVWHQLTGQPYEVEMPQKIYALRTVIPARPTAGMLRDATPDDIDLLTVWHVGFVRDALHDETYNSDDSRLWAERSFEYKQRRLFIWQIGGQPVALVGVTGPTPHGIRIGPVYTPPELRGMGYASAAVAAVSQQLLDEGREFCFLYTDADNPTSNKIYAAIGYEYVCESVMIRFGA